METQKSNHNVTSSNVIYINNNFSDYEESEVKVETTTTSGDSNDVSDTTVGTPTTVAIDHSRLLAYQNNRAMKTLINTKPAMKKTSWYKSYLQHSLTHFCYYYFYYYNYD